jgi:hypothetical protein
MEAAGIEPASDFDATGQLPCGRVICEECRAANALQGPCSDCHWMAFLDADLQRIVAAWNGLPAAIKAAFVVLGDLAECESLAMRRAR